MRPVVVREYLPEGLVKRVDGGLVEPYSAADETRFDAEVQGFLARFRALRRIDHPVVVHVHDCLRTNGTGYVILDNPEGETLARVLENRTTLTQEQLVEILYPVMEGLGSLHKAKLLHHEINPDNIVVQVDDLPVLIGFGVEVSEATGPQRASANQASTFVGLPSDVYTALERYSQCGPVGQWTDIYALGAIMYACVTGRAPADAPSRVVQDDMTPASEAAFGSYDPQLLTGIDAALALRVRDRPDSLGAWFGLLPGSVSGEDGSMTVDGRMAARRFQRSGETVPANDPAIKPSAVYANKESRLEDSARAARSAATSGNDAKGNGWTMPALAATFLIALLTWLDAGVLRSSDQPRTAASSAVAAAVSGAVTGARSSAGTESPLVPNAVVPPGTNGLSVVATAEESGRADSAIEPSGDGKYAEGPDTELQPNATGVDAPHGSLTLDLTPADAEVAIFGNDRVRYRPGVRLPEGTHRLGVTRSGYVSETRDVPVAGDTLLKIALRPERHPFSLSTVPTGATIRFVNRSEDYSPEMLLPPGDYPVSASLQGYETWKGTVAHGASPTDRQIALTTDKAGFADPLASGGLGPVMNIVPGGTYQRGCVSGENCFSNELPVTAVRFERPFALSKYEITADDFGRFAAATGVQPPGNRNHRQEGSHPVVNVSWADAVAYASWLSSETGRTYRLPSGSEWEYAARAGSATAYSWGNDYRFGKANCSGCGALAGQGTMAVGAFVANSLGLHDMHGNVWEWVADCPGKPQLPGGRTQALRVAEDCRNRVRRGGSWANSPRRMRAASRDVTNPKLRSSNTGFRVLLEVR